MADVATSGAVATKCTEILVDKAVKELPYLCCYKSYAVDFEEKKRDLKAAVESVDMKVKEAKTRNETKIDPIVKHWVDKANNLIQRETTPKKWFGFCTDWFSQCSLAKQLDSMTREIPTIMEKAENFSQVAHAAERPGMEFYSQEFMHFKSRNIIYEQLREELKDDHKCRIGLQAMGGSGKTTMAKAIGKEVENSKAFDKVIFIEVPNPVDEKNIRDEIAKKLELKLEDDKDLSHAEQIWIRIANAGNVLIIVDDVWKEFSLENIGIHHGKHPLGRCCVLVTTRHEKVCTGMRCQRTIKLEDLPEEDAVGLFLYHASESGNDCTNKVKLLASKIVNECGRLPVIVVAVAKTLRIRNPNEWEDAFVATEKDSSLRHGSTDEETKKFYNSLKISFECLDTGALDLILLCSIFPRAYEIPVELLSRIASGLGLCDNVDSYYVARSQVLSIKTTLVSSALLLTAGDGCVKMHDVIRDVAQQIGDEKIQEIRDSKTNLKENVKYSSWIINDFSNYFDGNHLELLLVWVNANGSLEVHDAFFGGMKGLRVLFLCSKVKFGRTLALSLPKSIHSLENIQTLSLTNWELGDISILQNLRKLQTLELMNCSITELPNEVSQLEKLKFLGLIRCSIKSNNPFEVIGRCSKLEVLYYVSNFDTLNINVTSSKITVLQELRIYQIDGGNRLFQVDASTKRYFNSTKFKGFLSESTVKSLAARAEILELTECDETRWTNLIPDMVHPREGGGMNDLIRLSLTSWPAIQWLINTSGIQSDATVFSNLVELRLHDMHVRELCHGDFPDDFLSQLEKLDLSHCVELDDTLFKGKLQQSNLKSVKLTNCSMTCLFHPSTAQSLEQLETLIIRECSKLKCIISDDGRSTEQNVDDHQDPNRKDHHSMFTKLKLLEVQGCHELEFILPVFPCKELERLKIYGCNELKYIFGQYLEDGGQYPMEKETILPLLQELKIVNVPKFIHIYQECYLPQHSKVQQSRGTLCCLFSKAGALSVEEPSFSKANQLDHAQELKEEPPSRAGGIFTQPLYPYKNLRKMSIEGFSELKSLLTLSTASSLKLLEELTIKKCDELEHIVTDKGHVYNHMNDFCIFPSLKQVSIFDAEKLKYLFGECHSNQKHNIRIELNLPDLKILCLDNVPNMVSICTKNYSVKALSLQDISLKNCPQLLINTVMDLSVDVREREEDLSKKKEKGKEEFTCLYINLASKAKSVPSTANAHSPPPVYQFNLKEIQITGFSQLTSLFTMSITSSLKQLETLKVEECDTLEHIITDEWPNSHGHMSVHSIFPNLQQVYIWSCNNLEYVFPAFYSKDFKNLEYVTIQSAEKMKYVFGKCHADQDHSVQIELNLPALKDLDLDDVPNMVSICAENYYVKVSNVEDISLEGCLQLPQTFIDFLVGGHRRHEDFSRRKALSFKEKGRHPSDLQKLPNLKERPKNFLSFQNLSELKFVGCKQLKFILSASTTKSIPELRNLLLSECEELVNIIQDDEENQQNPLDPHQSCFPKLCRIQVKQCKKLKYLFSISTCPKLPRLLTMSVEDAPELEQVFGWKQGAPLELVIKDVFPSLLGIRLVNLPSLHTIYQGIDFQTVKARIVRDCNNIPLASVSSSELFGFHASIRQDQMNFIIDNNFYARHMIYSWAVEREREESKGALERDKTISEQNNSTPDLADNEEASKETVEKDSTIQKQNSSSPNLRENTEASTNEIVEEQLPTSNTTETPSSISKKDNSIPKLSSSTHSNTISNLGISASTEESCEKESKDDQEELGEDISLNEGVRRAKEPTNDLIIKETNKKVAFAIPPTTTTEMNSALELCGKESMDDQQELEESRSYNEALRVEKEPTNECSSKETSNEIALTIPPSITVMTSPTISSISSPKKPQTPTSASHVEIKSGSSAVTDQSAQGQIMVSQRETSIDDDLIRLLRIMREGSELEVGQPSISNFAAFEDDKVAKAFVDIEYSLKMDLNQITNSEENTHRLENALNFLCTRFSEEEPFSHSLIKGKIDSLHKEIRRILLTFKQASDKLDTFTKLQEKEKQIDEQHSQRMEAATTLVSEIRNTKSYMIELKEHISRLQAELKSKEKEYEECEIKLSCLEKQKGDCILDTIGFMEEYQAVKKDKSYVVDDQAKARQELRKLENQWPSCVADLRKIALLLGILLKHKR